MTTYTTWTSTSTTATTVNYVYLTTSQTHEVYVPNVRLGHGTMRRAKITVYREDSKTDTTYYATGEGCRSSRHTVPSGANEERQSAAFFAAIYEVRDMITIFDAMRV